MSKTTMGKASRRTLTLLELAGGTVREENGRVTTLLSELTGKEVSPISFTSAILYLYDKNLIVKDTRGKRTYSVSLTNEGQKRAENPYYGLSAKRALVEWLARDVQGHRYSALPGDLGQEIAMLLDDGDGGWSHPSMTTAIRELEAEGKVSVHRKGEGGFPCSVELVRAVVDEDAPATDVDGEPVPPTKTGRVLTNRDIQDLADEAEVGYAPVQILDEPAAAARDIQHQGTDSISPESSPLSDPVDYHALALALLEQVMEQAANPPVIVQKENTDSLRASLRLMQSDLDAAESALTNLLKDHRGLLGKYNKACFERNEAIERLQVQAAKEKSSRSSGSRVAEALTPESRANLERLMKKLPK
jgi:hypothetical protein